MKKLSYEDGHLVLRNFDGTLWWNSHWVDLKGSYTGEPSEGGYKEIWVAGKVIENHDYYKEPKEEKDEEYSLLEEKAKLFEEFMALCTDSSPLRLMENLGELYQKGLKL